MKKLLLHLFLVCLMAPLVGACSSGCNGTAKVITFSDSHRISPSVSTIHQLLQHNIIVADNQDSKICGGTVIQHTGDTKILTAAHCIMDSEKRLVPFGFIYDGEEKYRFEVEDFNRKTDLALLEITDSHKELQAARLAMIPSNIGEDIWVLGYGAKIEDAVTKGIISKTYTKNHSGIDSTLLDITAFYGSSGGGVYNKAHELTGVVIQIGPAGPRDGWIYAVTLENIYNFLYPPF